MSTRRACTQCTRSQRRRRELLADSGSCRGLGEARQGRLARTPATQRAAVPKGDDLLGAGARLPQHVPKTKKETSLVKKASGGPHDSADSRTQRSATAHSDFLSIWLGRAAFTQVRFCSVSSSKIARRGAKPPSPDASARSIKCQWGTHAIEGVGPAARCPRATLTLIRASQLRRNIPNASQEDRRC